MPTALRDVRSRGQSGKHLLALSLSDFDPRCMVRPCVASVFVNLAYAVLHQCVRPLIGACGAPGHHGYQRAFELISGQASNGPFGSPVFACAGKTDPPSSTYPLADLGGYGVLATSPIAPCLAL